MFFEKYNKKTDGTIRFYDLHSTKTKIMCVVIFVLCLGIMVFSLFPSIWVFLASFKDIKEFRRNTTILPESFNIQTYIKTWNDLKFIQYYINSFISVTGCAICAVVFNGLLAYGLGVLKPRGYKIIYGLVMWSLLIPTTTSVVALFVNINRVGLNKSFIPIWLSLGANAFYVILFKQFFEGIPKEFIEAAKLDGASSLRIFRSVILPLSQSIVMVVIIFAVNAAWSDFLLPYLVLGGSGKETVMVRLFQFNTSNATDVEVLRGVAFSIIPPIILFAIFQKQITLSVSAGGIKG
ncbi:multiple sugar transport system permease protein [Mobilisporobacter senegalensis]|uniref:Multiple sugar transport system permease protein n=1 Tax=Mobilisporobacter senegalensis TaxID=1329262 RepID=A0A3N1XZ30_9FIRM|nr:carbohydrate ABC transporter permease [Mobilisporobacter senegalensis]ROR31829.1 multiple sugar transport system permease protein [Mobilisporobacter senegalensis]